MSATVQDRKVPAVASRPPADRPFPANHRILVIDDSESIHDDFRKILGPDSGREAFDAEEASVFGRPAPRSHRADFAIAFATQGQEALELVHSAINRGERYALAFVDMRMPPGWDGLETTQKLWEADPDLQIVICTAYSDYSWEEMMEVTAAPERLLILKKPFDSIEVLQFAHALTEKWSLLQAARSNTDALEQIVAERTRDLRGVNALLEAEVVRRRHAQESAQSSEREQRQLARELELERARLVAAQAVAKVGSWEIDLVAGGVAWSEETFRIFEADPHQFAPSHEHFLSFVHPDDRAAVEESFRRSVEEGTSGADEYRVILPSGREKTIEERWDIACDEDGKRTYATGTVQDITERKQALQTLQKEREFLSALIDNVSDGIVACDRKGVLTLFNDATVRFHGLSAAAIPPEEWAEHFDLYLPDGETLMTKEQVPLFRALTDGTVLNAEMVIAPRIGKRSRMMVSGRAFLDARGESLGAVVVMHDVTEQQESEAALRAAEEKFRSIFNNSLEGIFRTSPDGRFLDANPAVARMLGFASPAELLAERVDIETQGYVEPRRRAEFKQQVEAAGVVHGFEYEAYRRDGTKVWLSEESRAVRNAAGELEYFEGTLQDITNRKSAEDELRKQASLINLAADAILVTDMADRVEFWSDGAERLYGWTRQEAVGRRVSDFLYRGESVPYLAATQTLLQTGEYSGESEHLCKSGQVVTVRTRWTLVRDKQGGPQARLIIETDITEQKKLEQQFLRAQRLESIGTLASGVAHDLNNILAPILMSVPLLREELTIDLKNKIVDTVEKSAERGALIVKQVLTFARGVEGARVLLDPTHLIKEIAQIIEETFPKTVRLTVRYAEGLALIEGDPTQLHQVLLNLAVNARDAMPTGGKLTVSAENFAVDEHYAAMIPGLQPGSYLLINVSDTGTGISSDVMEKMFDPFFTTKQIGKGTGLGLSTVLGIVKSHGGNVSASSSAAGTTFRVLLPAAAAGQHLTGITASVESPRGRGETILVVDDEPAIREVAEVFLAKSGYKVIVADDGPAALAILAQRPGEVAVMVTDLLMPVMNGFALARIVRKMDSALNVIVSSGREEDCSSADVKAIGISAFLTKPYTQQMLLRTLDRILHPVP